MKFQDLLKLTEASRAAADSFRTTGEAMAKEKAKSSATTDKAKDAARKRAERSREVPRERKSKSELVREVIAVKTASGSVQLIFKDSFNKNIHTKINKNEALSEAEAKEYTNDPKFEQTRASKLLFGELKQKEATEKKEKKPEEQKEKKEGGKKEEEKEVEEKPKAKRLSKEEMMKAMLQMSPEQLAEMPPELQQDFFQRLRSPMSAKDFDNLTFENLTNKFGINTLANVPYNQQVLNALLFVAKIKAGASDQEMQTLLATSNIALDFTKAAFLQANKILSQIGDGCIQNLVSSIEMGSSSMYSEGVPELECGEYKFKISAGGEFSVSTGSNTQSNKIIKGIIGNAIGQALSNPDVIRSDKGVMAFSKELEQTSENFGIKLLPDESVAAILSDPDLVSKFKNYEIKSPSGKSLGPAIDKDGNMNPAISVSAYERQVKDSGRNLFKGNKGGELFKNVITNILKTSLRGDSIRDPKLSPNHVITANGIFPLSDDYINEIARTARVDIKKSDNILDNGNISNYKKTSAQNLQKWKTVVEAKEESIDIEKLFVDSSAIDPTPLVVNDLINNFSIDLNVSLLPGFKPEDINAIEYNFITIDGKVTKIPVNRTEKIATKLAEENYNVLNEVLYESLTNNFLLKYLNKSQLLSDTETYAIEKYGIQLVQEDDLRNATLLPILNSISNKTKNNPEYLVPIFENILQSCQEEYKRDYKQEYRNYHGKPKQRKQRAARTKARELMIKKGIVKKGDGIDIDHKRPLRSGGSNGVNNLRKRKKSENRSDNGHKKGEKQDKDWT